MKINSELHKEHIKKLKQAQESKSGIAMRAVKLAMLCNVSPHKYSRREDIKGRSPHDIEIEIESVEAEGSLLKVMARAWMDGTEFIVDNPLYYFNPPIMIPDGTTQVKLDWRGREIMVPNYIEDADEALRRIVMETIKVTSLGVIEEGA